MFKIINFPDPILRKQIPEFDFSNPSMDPVQLEKDLIETMLENNGIGLAANQVGLSIRVFVMGHKQTPETAQAFFNPYVIKTVDEIDNLEEGCLSFPGMFVKVRRPRKILVGWQNSQGEPQQGELDGYDCKCFLHELDHLEGIVFKDRISLLKWNRATKKKGK